LPSCAGARQGFCIVADGCVHLSDERGIANGGYLDFAGLDPAESSPITARSCATSRMIFGVRWCAKTWGMVMAAGEEVRAAESVLRVSVPVVGRTPVGRTPVVGAAVNASGVAIVAPVNPPVNSAECP
jgi:hypothetical protein